LEDGSLLCGAAEGISTREPWNVTCRACLAVARVESVDQPGPHPFRYHEHYDECHTNDPHRAWRHDTKPWNGRW
jgi:hypothetical protein